MLFKRKNKQPLGEMVGAWVWPRKGWSRTLRYVWFRIARLPGTTHSIAAGFASGAAVSFTPFLGFHFLLGFLVAWLTRGNLFASAIGTFIGNPWTLPLMFTLNDRVGTAILGDEFTVQIPDWTWEQIWEAPGAYVVSLAPAIIPLMIGSIPSVIIAWFLFYFVFKWMLSGYHKRRQEKKKPDYLVGETKSDK